MEIISEKQKQSAQSIKRNKRLYRKLYFLLFLVGFFIFLSLISNFIVPHNPDVTNPSAVKLPPSYIYPFGTDNYGRCIFSRVLAGAKTSIFSSFALVGITFIIGTVIGVLSGYYGGIVESVFMRITDMILSFPNMIIAIVIAGVMGGSLRNAMIALGVTSWTQYARIARSSVLKVKEEMYVHAAEIMGNSNISIINRYIVPNIMGPLLVTATLQIATMMISIAGLSFLGLGVQLPKAEWGSMISEGSKFLQVAPWMSILPGIVMIFVVIIFNLLGEIVRDIMDPKRI